MQHKVCVISLNVNDMDAAIDFYCNDLGFALKSRQDYPDIVELGHEGPTLILYRVDLPASLDYPRASGTILNLQTDNLDADLAEFRQKGLALIHDTPQPCPVGVYAAFRDPAGNVLELLEYRSAND